MSLMRACDKNLCDWTIFYWDVFIYRTSSITWDDGKCQTNYYWSNNEKKNILQNMRWSNQGCLIDRKIIWTITKVSPEKEFNFRKFDTIELLLSRYLLTYLGQRMYMVNSEVQFPYYGTLKIKHVSRAYLNKCPCTVTNIQH